MDGNNIRMRQCYEGLLTPRSAMKGDNWNHHPQFGKIFPPDGQLLWDFQSLVTSLSLHENGYP